LKAGFPFGDPVFVYSIIIKEGKTRRGDMLVAGILKLFLAILFPCFRKLRLMRIREEWRILLKEYPPNNFISYTPQ
jgi:hypothetical protein